MKSNIRGIILGFHNIEPYSYKNEYSSLYNNLTVTPDFLEKFISDAKAEGFNFVSMKQFINDEPVQNNGKRLLITIDDGWKGVYTYAFPIFKKHNIPFLFYIAPDLIDNGFMNCKLPEMDGMDILCDHIRKITEDNDKRQTLFNKIWKQFKYKKRLFFWKNGHDIMQSFFKERINFAEYKIKNCCSPENIREMARCDICEIGSHTSNHIHMDRLSKKNVIKQFEESKSRIEEYIQKECSSFSYPYGHFNTDTVSLSRKYYKNAVIVNRKNNPNMFATTTEDDIFIMPRKFIDMKCSFDKLVSSFKASIGKITDLGADE